MADPLRCPMCGRPNAPDQEVCRFCQARLKPLVSAPFSGEGAPIKPGEPPVKHSPTDPESALPDWLRDLRQKEEQSPAQAPGTGREEPLPDWLTEDTEDRLPAEGTGLEEASNWWSRISQPGEPQSFSGPGEPGEESPAPPASQEEGGEPDWLKRIRSHRQAEEHPPQGAILPDREGAGAQAFPLSAPSSPPGEPQPASQDSDLPDWLSRLAPSEPEEEAPWLPGAKPASQEELPDWLKKLEASTYDRPPESSVPAFVAGDETELPIDLGAEPEAGEKADRMEQEPAESPYPATLPEWLSKVSAEGESAEGEPAQDDQETSLAPAQLPAWLEAMRPIEAAAPAAPLSEEHSTQIEKVGPLAGLRGVIPAEPVIGHLRKPPAYSMKMQVSESQHRSAVLLQKLLASEGEARPVPARPGFTSQAVLRLLIAAALFLAVLLPLWMNSQRLPLPDPTYLPAGLVETLDLINALNGGEQVLLAVDYEPGLSAELEAASTSIVEQIAARGASFSLVSTNPAGPLLAERLFGGLNRDRGSDPLRYTNFGLIAGGPTGLLNFASGRLLAEAAMVVVITENADTARSWIEQVQPALQPANVPLVMIVSAQAEPLVRPYFESSPAQVNGLVSGLQGGAAFEGLTGQAGPVRGVWDAFGWGLIVAEALILVGGLINILLAWLIPHKGAEGEGPQ